MDFAARASVDDLYLASSWFTLTGMKDFCFVFDLVSVRYRSFSMLFVLLYWITFFFWIFLYSRSNFKGSKQKALWTQVMRATYDTVWSAHLLFSSSALGWTLLYSFLLNALFLHVHCFLYFICGFKVMVMLGCVWSNWFYNFLLDYEFVL